MHDFQEQCQTVPCVTVHLSLYSLKQCMVLKQLSDSVFVMSWIISKWYQPRPLAQLITVTLSLIIPDIKKALSNDYSIMPSFIYFGVQARGNGGIKGGHSNSTRDKRPCVFRTLLGMSTVDWNLSEILLSKTTKLFVCSKWQMTRKTALRQRNLSTIFTGKSSFFIIFVTFLLLKCWCGWHWFCCYTVHVVISLLDSVGDINL